MLVLTQGSIVVHDCKPRIRRDIWRPQGFICWSRSWHHGRPGFKRKVGTGLTMREAYENWKAQE